MQNIISTAQEQEMTGLAHENLSTGQEKYQQNKGTGLALVSDSSAGSPQVNTRFDDILREMAKDRQYTEKLITEQRASLEKLITEQRTSLEKLILEQRANSDKRFGDVNKRFDDVNKRFEDMNKRFDDVNKRFDDMNTRFKEQQAHSDKHFESILREMAQNRQHTEKLLAERQAHSDKLLAERQANSDKRFADMQKSFNRLVTTILAVMAMAVSIVIGLSQL